jgi:hypothetical protein
VIGGLRTFLAMEGNGLVGPYATCNHEDGKEAGVGSAHGVGDEADAGGGGQQIVLPRRLA